MRSVSQSSCTPLKDLCSCIRGIELGGDDPLMCLHSLEETFGERVPPGGRMRSVSQLLHCHTIKMFYSNT
jgi:hypothetical protein